jgi:hypothetical protein
MISPPPGFPTVEERAQRLLEESNGILRSRGTEPGPPSQELLDLCRELAQDEYRLCLEIYEETQAGEEWKA